jgi:hypothetical protein
MRWRIEPERDHYLVVLVANATYSDDQQSYEVEGREAMIYKVDLATGQMQAEDELPLTVR